MPPERRPGPGPAPNANEPQADPQAPSLAWQFAREVNLADEDARRPDMALDLMEKAREGSRPVALYVFTMSDDRRMQNAREASNEMEEKLFLNYQVASRLAENYTLIRVDIEDLDSRTQRKYGIRSAPQLLLFDSEVSRAAAAFTHTSRPRDVANALDQVKERNDAIVEREERRRSR